MPLLYAWEMILHVRDTITNHLAWSLSKVRFRRCKIKTQRINTMCTSLVLLHWKHTVQTFTVKASAIETSSPEPRPLLWTGCFRPWLSLANDRYLTEIPAGPRCFWRDWRPDNFMVAGAGALEGWNELAETGLTRLFPVCAGVCKVLRASSFLMCSDALQ